MAPDSLVITHLLERNARQLPHGTLVTFDDGTEWTHREALEHTFRAANALRDRGVTRGDRVALMLRNGPDYLRVWWGATALGAIVVPVNIAYRGSMLEHLFRVSQPNLTIADPDFAETLTALGADTAPVVQPAQLHSDDLAGPASDTLRESDVAAYLLTSGTTGPSKLAAVSYRTSFRGGSWLTLERGATRDDVLLVDLPLFHGAAMYLVHGALAAGMQLAVRERPDLRNYWSVARETGATHGVLLSSMVTFLLAQPVRAGDREHRMRVLSSAPLPPDPQGFVERFGLAELATSYGSTEAPSVLGKGPEDSLVPGSCGRRRPGIQARLVDDNDCEVSDGATGELIVRADEPWELMTGYVGNASAQAEAHRNGWFHTGDLMRRDPEGNYFFVDRKKDSLRRRGENISSFEVEEVVQRFPGVVEAACVAYRETDALDDDVKVWVILEKGKTLDFAELLAFAAEHLPHFMVPTYFEVATEFPKTPSARVLKVELRRKGNGPATWDRNEHGFELTRHGLRRNGQSPAEHARTKLTDSEGILQ